MNPEKTSIYSLVRKYIQCESTRGNYQDLFITRLPSPPGKPKLSYSENYIEQNQVILDAPTKENFKMPKKSIEKFVIPEGTNAEKLKALADYLDGCKLCEELASTRNKIVFGSGNPNADVLFIGEAPGRDEDIQGLPFVGRSGKLLLDIVQKGMKLGRNDVYIANILKCRPPQNRNPKTIEKTNCTPVLNLQLEIIKPKVIITLGMPSSQYITGKKLPMGELRGKFHDYKGIPVMPTYHPAYLLRNYSKDNRLRVWEDIKKVMEFLKK